MPGFYFDFMLLLFIAPALLLGMLAQWMIHSRYARAKQIRASMTGAQAARRILDASGLHNVDVVPTQGMLSDHYDPRAKVLRLSHDVFYQPSMAAVGIAAHEAGHALQDAHRYLPLVVRNLAVPAANFGSSGGMILLMLGVLFNWPYLLLAGIVLFGCVVFFQLVNLPVEFDASSRAKDELVRLGIVHQDELTPVKKVLNAAALTYVAATLQSVLTLLYYIMRFTGGRRE